MLYVSLEMPRASLTARAAAQATGISAKRIIAGRLTHLERTEVLGFVTTFAQSPLHFVDRTSLTVVDISARASEVARLAAKVGKRLALIVVDHVGLVKPSPKARFNTRAAEVAAISRGMRWLAGEHGAHVLFLAQVNREGEDLPQLRHLKDSGSLEEDADRVLILHRKRDRHGLFVDDAAKLFVAKNRSGELTYIPLRFDARTMRFLDAADGGAEHAHGCRCEACANADESERRGEAGVH